MENILYGLFNGNIIPWERRPYNSEKQSEIFRKIDIEERHFLATLSPDDRRRFETYTLLQHELSNASDEDIFAYGFSLGLLSAFDIVRYAEQMPRH